MCIWTFVILVYAYINCEYLLLGLMSARYGEDIFGFESAAVVIAEFVLHFIFVKVKEESAVEVVVFLFGIPEGFERGLRGDFFPVVISDV